MVNELRALLRDNISSAPPDDEVDLSVVVKQGRRLRRRHRGFALVGGIAAVTAAVVGVGSLVGQDSGTDGVADRPPSPDAPSMSLGAAEPAVADRDYRVLASHTNENLNRRNGQYFDGVTDDGLILFRDGPHGIHNTERRALMDPATGNKDWLPEPSVIGDEQLWPMHLGADRLVFSALSYHAGGGRGGPRGEMFALVYDRQARTWHRTSWPSLPRLDGPDLGVIGTDGRLYVRVPAEQGEPPAGGWPTDSVGEADDAGAAGDSYDVWSVSLSDPADVRNEHLRVGDLAFTDEAMVWTDRRNGDAGLIHVRDLASGEENSFDPHAGDRCNLLTFGVAADRIVLGQYCGTYDDGVRDDRVQILTTEGDQVVTVQDSGIDGGLGYAGGSDVVTIDAYGPDQEGAYLYDLSDDRFLRVSDSISRWTMGGPTPPGLFMWGTSANDNQGATQWLGEWLASE